MQNITVYTQPGCGPCLATKRMLDSRGLAYREVDMQSIDEHSRQQVLDLGHVAAPVVVVEQPDAEDPSQRLRSWSSFRPDLIDDLQPGPANPTP